MAPEGVCKQRRIARFLKTIVFGAAIGFSLPALAQTDIAAGCEAAAICAEDLAALLAAEAVPAPAARLGNAAVSISVDGEALVGSPADEDADRRADVDLEAVDIQIKFDGLDAERSLSVATAGEGRIHTPEALIEFIGHWNYPAWIERAEVRIFEAPGLRRRLVSSRPVAIVALDETGRGAWLPGAATTGSFVYVLRVYDAYNRFDETEAQRLEISDDATLLPQMVLHGENSGRGVVEERPASPLPGYDVNQLARSAIPIEGGAVTVYGRNLPQGLAVSVMGRDVPVAPDRDFVIQTILPAGEHLVDVAVSETGGSRSVEFARAINIPTSQWFYVGLADLTVGRRFGKDSKLLAPVKSGEYSPVYRKGRLAFYLKGKIRGRYILTASLDTDEENLDTLFSGMDRKDPRQLLRRLDPDDYYPVYGDDSILKEDAPTAGKFYVRIDRGSSHVMWGNFKTRIDGVELARYERALYGAEADLR